MKNISKASLLAGFLTLPLSSTHAFAAITAADIQKALEKDPKILEEILKDNKELLNDVVIEILRDNKILLIDIIQQGAESKRSQQLNDQWTEDVKTPKLGSITLEGRPTRGNENAPITLVAFSDFACTYCMQAAATIESLLAKYPNQIRFIFKQSVSDTPVAQEAARWFLAALEQDKKKAWNFYASLFANQQAFFAKPTETLKEIAEGVHLDVKALENDVRKNGAKYAKIIEEDSADAEKLGFKGTPYFLMNDLVIRGSLPLENFIDAYEFALKHKK